MLASQLSPWILRAGEQHLLGVVVLHGNVKKLRVDSFISFCFLVSKT